MPGGMCHSSCMVGDDFVSGEMLPVQALNTLFFSNNYDWKPFVIALVASVVGMLLMGAVEVLILEPLLGRAFPGYFRRHRAGATVPPVKSGSSRQAPLAHPAAKEESTASSSVYSPYPKA